MGQATIGNKKVRRTVMLVKEINILLRVPAIHQTLNVPTAFSMQGMTRSTAPYATSGSTSDVFTSQALVAEMLNDNDYQISWTFKECNRGPKRSWDT